MRRLRLVLDALRPPSSRHRYGPHRCHRADLHLPGGQGPHPVVVLIHGGSWKARYTRRMMRGLARDLVRRGWAAWNVEYRRVGLGQGGGWPDTYEDISLAIDHLASLDAELDLSRVVAIGYSAGGPLALWAAARPRLPEDAPGARPKVVVGRVASQAGVCNMTDAARTDPGSAVRRFLGGEPEQLTDAYRLADPVERVPLKVDTLLVHGEIDETVPVRRSQEYAAAARFAGDEVELVEPDGADHHAHIDPRSEAWQAVASWLER